MKKLLLLFLLIPFLAGSQTITDTSTLRTRINTQIVPNGTQAITGQMLNNILNGYLNAWPDNRINTSPPLAWNPTTRTLVFTGTFTGVPTSRTITINGITFDLSANRTWSLTTTNIPEGTNLYWTQARFNTAFAAKTTTDLAEGTNLYFTNVRARAAISSGGSPIVYNPSTGVISLTTVPVSKGGTGLTSAGTAGQLIKSTGSGFILFTPQYLTAADTAGLGYNNLLFESGVQRTGNIVRALHDAGIWNANEFVGFAIQTGQPLQNDIWQFKTEYNGWRRVQPSTIVSDGGGLTVEVDPIYTANGVPKIRTITINGVGYDLSANRAWTLTTDNVSEGATNLYFTNSRARTAISLTTAGSSGVATYNNATGVLNIPNYVQTITLTGDVTGTGTTSILTTLATVNANVGTFNNVTVNGKGLVTAASNVAYLTANQSITWTGSGDVSGSASGATSLTPTLTLATVNSNVGTFGSANQVPQITVNGKGLVTAVSNVTITGFASSTLASANIYVGNVSNVATARAVSGDMTLNNTGVFTLNTVNANVGTFNNVTVNGKGLVTAASNVAYLTAETDPLFATKFDAQVFRNTTSFIIGKGTTDIANGAQRSIALGHNNYNMQYNYSISIGTETTVNNDSTINIGNFLLAGGVENSISIGNRVTLNNDGIGIGYFSRSTGDQTIAIGNNASATDDQSVAIGAYSRSGLEGTVAIGFNAKADSSWSMALGWGAVVTKQYQIMIGHPTTNAYFPGGVYATALTNLATQTRIIGQVGSTGQAGFLNLGTNFSLSGGTLNYNESGINSLAAIGSSPNANGATISGNTLNLQPASQLFGGVVTTGTQEFDGLKRFHSAIYASSFWARNSAVAGDSVTAYIGPFGYHPGYGATTYYGGNILLKGAKSPYTGTLTAEFEGNGLLGNFLWKLPNISGTLAVTSAQINPQTTSYTLTPTDNGKIIDFTSAGAVNVTVPTLLPVGFNCMVRQLGAGQVTFVASSTTIHNRNGHTKTAGQYAVASLIYVSTNVYTTSGDMQ